MDANKEMPEKEATACAAHKMNNSLAVIKVKTYLMLKGLRAGSLRAADLEKNLEDITAIADRMAELIKELRGKTDTAEADLVIS